MAKNPNCLTDSTAANADSTASAEVSNAALKLDVNAVKASTSESQAGKQRKPNTPPAMADSVPSFIDDIDAADDDDDDDDDDKADVNCLLLADSSLSCAPLQLRQMLQHFDADALTPGELLLLLVYCVALESGFVTSSEYQKCLPRLKRLAASSSFHSRNVRRLTRLPPSYAADRNKSQLTMRLRSILNIAAPTEQLSALLSCLVSGDFLIVTLTPQLKSQPGRSVCLSIGRYVLYEQPHGKPLYQRFRKLDELSQLLRENVYVPVRNAQLAALDIGIYPSLLGLPAELYEALFRNLNGNQLKIVANVCRHLNYFSTQSKFFAK